MTMERGMGQKLIGAYLCGFAFDLAFAQRVFSSSSLVNSASIPDPRVDKRKAHAHNASLEGVARERESARSHCTLRERDFNTRCEYALCEREIERETAHVCADQYFVPFRAPYMTSSHCTTQSHFSVSGGSYGYRLHW